MTKDEWIFVGIASYVALALSCGIEQGERRELAAAEAGLEQKEQARLLRSIKPKKKIMVSREATRKCYEVDFDAKRATEIACPPGIITCPPGILE